MQSHLVGSVKIQKLMLQTRELARYVTVRICANSQEVRSPTGLPNSYLEWHSRPSIKAKSFSKSIKNRRKSNHRKLTKR